MFLALAVLAVGLGGAIAALADRALGRRIGWLLLVAAGVLLAAMQTGTREANTYGAFAIAVMVVACLVVYALAGRHIGIGRARSGAAS